MQENVNLVSENFPGRKVIVDGNTVKVSVPSLDKVQFLRVAEISKQAKGLNAKRSGTGLTLIFKF